jgi:hypothetical protein
MLLFSGSAQGGGGSSSLRRRKPSRTSSIAGVIGVPSVIAMTVFAAAPSADCPASDIR